MQQKPESRLKSKQMDKTVASMVRNNDTLERLTRASSSEKQKGRIYSLVSHNNCNNMKCELTQRAESPTGGPNLPDIAIDSTHVKFALDVDMWTS